MWWNCAVQRSSFKTKQASTRSIFRLKYRLANRTARVGTFIIIKPNVCVCVWNASKTSSEKAGGRSLVGLFFRILPIFWVDKSKFLGIHLKLSTQK